MQLECTRIIPFTCPQEEYATEKVLKRLAKAIRVSLSSKKSIVGYALLIDLTLTLSDAQMIQLMDYIVGEGNVNVVFPKSMQSNMIFAFTQLQRSQLLSKWMQMTSTPWGMQLLPAKESDLFTFQELRCATNPTKLKEYASAFNKSLPGSVEVFLRDERPRMWESIQKALKVPFNETTCFGQLDAEKVVNALVPLVSAERPYLNPMVDVTQLSCIPLAMSGDLYQSVIEMFSGTLQKKTWTSLHLA